MNNSSDVPTNGAAAFYSGYKEKACPFKLSVDPLEWTRWLADWNAENALCYASHCESRLFTPAEELQSLMRLHPEARLMTNCAGTLILEDVPLIGVSYNKASDTINLRFDC